MQCKHGSYEVTTSYYDPYEWDCRDFLIKTVDGQPSLTESIAECPADTNGRISSCMCNMETYPERGC